MKGANASMLLQAIKEMEQQYIGPHLAHHLVRFRTILRRSKTLTPQDKQILEDHMNHNYDSLLDEDPDVQERIIRGKIEGQRKAVIDFIEVRFPTLLQRLAKMLSQ